MRLLNMLLSTYGLNEKEVRSWGATAIAQIRETFPAVRAPRAGTARSSGPDLPASRVARNAGSGKYLLD